MSFWRDKVVLVTGGSAGFGVALAQSFLRAGAKVVLTARDKDRLHTVVQEMARVGGCVEGFPADVTQAEDVASLLSHCLDRFQRLDVLVNNVGHSDRGLAAETPPERYRELWEANFLSAVRCTQAMLPHLISSRGHVVFMGSLAAKVAARYLGAYPASKFPLTAFAQQLRLETKDSGVHILLVCPGPIARPDSGQRYDQLVGNSNLPVAAARPGGGIKVKGLDPDRLAYEILRACERRRPELVLPGKARWLFALAQLWPKWGDWIIERQSG